MNIRLSPLLAISLHLAACTSSSTVKQDPNEPSASDIFVRKGAQYMENGQLEIALRDLQHAVDLDPRNAEAHNALAALYERLNRPEDAFSHYEKALSLDENDGNTLNNYGRLLCGQGKHEQAMGLFRRAIDAKLYRQPWVPLTNAGICSRSTGKTQEAAEYLRRALESNPTFSPTLLEMAKLSLEEGQYMSARAFLQRYESAAGPTAESLWIGFQTEHALGNLASQRDYANALRSRFPDSREAAQLRKLDAD